MIKVKYMNKYPLIGGSICAVVLLVLASLTNVVGYQTVQASNQKIITTELSEKDLLFQTLVDMVNNKDIQRVILGSELTSRRPFDSDIKFSTFKFPLITEKLLNRIYTIGSILFKTYSKWKMHSILQQYQVSNQEVQKEINAVIEKDVKLSGELKQLSNFKCDCEGNNMSPSWTFFFLCHILVPITFIVAWIWVISHHILFNHLLDILGNITSALNCWG